MGEQIHLGGLQSSLDLAERGALQAGQTGIIQGLIVAQKAP